MKAGLKCYPHTATDRVTGCRRGMESVATKLAGDLLERLAA
jgi:hypothetical protein